MFSAVIGVLRGNAVIVASTLQTMIGRFLAEGFVRLSPPLQWKSQVMPRLQVSRNPLGAWSLNWPGTLLELAREHLATGQGPFWNWPGTVLQLATDPFGIGQTPSWSWTGSGTLWKVRNPLGTGQELSWNWSGTLWKLVRSRRSETVPLHSHRTGQLAASIWPLASDFCLSADTSWSLNKDCHWQDFPQNTPGHTRLPWRKAVSLPCGFLHTAHCTLHTAHCTLHAAHFTLHTTHCVVHSAHCSAH